MKHKRFQNDVLDEISRARKGHPPIHSHHEGYSVLLEEVEEYWEEVKKKSKNRNPKKIYKELVQVSAMAQRIVEDVL